MAICWYMSPTGFDSESAWSPERYSPERTQQQTLATNSVPLADLVILQKETFNPSAKGNDSGSYVVLDTTHAYEGRIQFRGKPVSIDGVGSIKRPLQPGYVIISRLRTYLRQVALVDDAFTGGVDAMMLCSTEFYVLAPKNRTSDIAFLVPYLLSAPVQKAFAAAEEGGHHPRIQPDVLLNIAVPRSLIEKRDDFSRRFRKSIKFIRQGEELLAELHTDTATAASHESRRPFTPPVEVP